MTATFTVLTSLLLVLECVALALLVRRHRSRVMEDQLAARLMGDRGPEERNAGRELAPWVGVFIALAVAYLFAAVKHALGGAPVAPMAPGLRGAVATYGTALGLVTVASSLASVTAVNLAQTAAIRRYAPSDRGAGWRHAVGTQHFLASLWVVLMPLSFVPVLAQATLGLGSVLVAEVRAWSGGEGRGWIIAGLLVAGLAGVVFVLDATFPPGLDRSNVGHLIMAGGFWMIYAGLKAPSRA